MGKKAPSLSLVEERCPLPQGEREGDWLELTTLCGAFERFLVEYVESVPSPLERNRVHVLFFDW